LNHYVEEAQREDDFSSVREVGVYVTSSKRSHNYVILFVELEGVKVGNGKLNSYGNGNE